MTSLTYRGKTYVKSNAVADKQQVELTYRRNVYTNRKKLASKQLKAQLSYRGVNYQK